MQFATCSCSHRAFINRWGLDWIGIGLDWIGFAWIAHDGVAVERGQVVIQSKVSI